ncbi:GH92 family glycosyl hydrolase [Chitinophaga agrisoli]|nr:GH92 family glycosyl hydrolase [Chitinophaga agrisoli]
MTGKRRWLLPALLAGFLPLAAQEKQQPADLVYPQLDAENSRWFYFSSAARPFGMVSLFPDNHAGGDWDAGYRYKVDTISDFSHIHEWQLAGVAVMPVTFSANGYAELFRNAASPFSHKNETVSPGYHAVVLERYATKVELTATSRAGLHRYTFPANKQRGVIFELGGLLGPSNIITGGFERISDREIRGYVINGPTSRRPKPYTVYFAAQFQQPIQQLVLYQNGKSAPAPLKWNGQQGKLLVQLTGNNTAQVLMKVGLSYTSQAAAAANLQHEAPDWNFDAVALAAKEEWNKLLGRIQLTGGSLQQQRRFYTDLWHALQGRRVISDVDGKWTDCTGAACALKQVPLDAAGHPRFPMYNSDSFWGAQWTLNTLWSLVYPEIVESFCNAFLEYYKSGGLIPRGPAGGNYTYVMTGAQTTPFYVSAWQKGIRGFDMHLAYEGLRKDHFPGGMMSKAGYEHNTAKGGGVEHYIANGYVPYPVSDTAYGMHQDGAAMTLEYAYQDWCLAQLATALGKTDDAQLFLQRAKNYQHLYNPHSGFIVPRDRAGNWRANYDPLQYEHGFEEGNGAQWTWFVPHDLPGLFTLMGGKDTAITRLNQQFEVARQYGFCDQHPELPGGFVNNKRLWINYSNQPNMQAAFIFNYAGAPWLTQYWSRTVLDSVYSDLSPQFGYNGDEDQGLMGSLCVLMKMGLFQMNGGCEPDPKYEIGSPVFSSITIHLQPEYYKAAQFTIVARNASPENMYVQSATVGGQPLSAFYIRQSDINAGKTLILEMGSQPNKHWGIQRGQ